MRATVFHVMLLAAVLAAGTGCSRRRVARTFADAGGPALPGTRDGGRRAAELDAGVGSGELCPGRDAPSEPSEPIAIEFDPIDAVDILFVVDDSSTMAHEQAQLAEQFPQLFAILSQSTAPPSTPRSVHLGVVSGDLGLEGVTGVTGCVGSGKAAALQHASDDDDACARSVPTFVNFVPVSGDQTQAARDMTCLTQLGTNGCGVQQPLEVVRRALAQGDPTNSGFLRAGGGEERAVLAVVVVSDKDDCSIVQPERWAEGASFDPADEARRAQQMLVRCAQRGDELSTPTSFAPTFELPIRADREFVFAALTGIPRFTDAHVALNTARDQPTRDAFYSDLLDDSRMQYQVDDQGTEAPEDDELAPVCEGNQGKGWPARRLVEMAQRSGANGIVGSICDDIYAHTIDAVQQRIAQLLVGPCLAQPLLRGRDGLVACDLIWTLPEGATLSSDSDGCEDPSFPFLQRLPPLARSRETRCRVAQLEVAARDGGIGAVPTVNDGQRFEQGWFYDDFSGDSTRQCPAHPRRVALTAGVKPPEGIRIALECRERAFDPSAPDCKPQP